MGVVWTTGKIQLRPRKWFRNSGNMAQCRRIGFLIYHRTQKDRGGGNSNARGSKGRMGIGFVAM